MSSRRNEEARARRRQKLKERLSLTSVPRSEVEAEASGAAQNLNLGNHFGWTVLDRRQVGDGTFPHMTQFQEKPDLSGKDFQKVTYVLYLEKGTVVDKTLAPKQTQTTISGTYVGRETPSPLGGTDIARVAQPSIERTAKEESKQHTTVTLPPEDYFEKRVTDLKQTEKKNKLISEFYYIPKDRSRSRSPKRAKSKKKGKFRAGDSDIEYELKEKTPATSKSQMSEIESVMDLDERRRRMKEEIAQALAEEEEEAIQAAKKEVEKKMGKKLDKWTLRAGAEHTEIDLDYEYKIPEQRSTGIVKTESKLIPHFKYDSVKYGRSGQSEHLLDTPSGSNRYLYVSRDKILKKSNRKSPKPKEEIFQE